MDRFLIETPHSDENCLALVEELNAQGYLHNFEWGCRAGVHSGWVIIEAENEAQARLSVPPLVRNRARIVRLNKFTSGEVAALHAEKARTPRSKAG